MVEDDFADGVLAGRRELSGGGEEGAVGDVAQRMPSSKLPAGALNWWVPA